MKSVSLLVLVAALLTCSSFVLARYIPQHRGGHTHNGIEGTVEAIGSSGFTLAAHDGKTLKILCNSNTVFRKGKKTAAATDIKEGTRVNVQGGTLNANELMANTVEILPASSRKKKKK